MVINDVHVIRPRLAVLLFAAVLLTAQVEAKPPAVVLAPGLAVTLPDSLVVRSVELPGQAEGAMLIGDIGNSPGYFLAGIKVTGKERNYILWRRLEAEISSRSDGPDYDVTARGNFATQAGESVRYRAYQYRAEGQIQRQIYYLVSGGRSNYWLTVTVVDGVNIELVIPIVQALVRRIRVVP